MKKYILFLLLIIVIGCSPKLQPELLEISQHFNIDILDPEGQQLIDADAKINIEASGFMWSEGPLWVEEGKYLLFSDIPRNKVFKFDRKGDTTTYLFPSGFSGDHFTGEEPGSNGLLLDPNGNLVLLQHGNRQIARMKAPLDQPQPIFETLVDHYQGKRLNSPNDAVFDRQGNLYFTDPPYGLPKRMQDPEKELAFQGVFCLRTDGQLVLLDTLSRPNGIGLSPQEDQLYVGVSDGQHAVWYQYDVIMPGQVENKRIFFDATTIKQEAKLRGAPDGLKVHSKGYVFGTGPGGVWVFNASGKPLIHIKTGLPTANCAFADNESKLYITADDYLLSVSLKRLKP